MPSTPKPSTPVPSTPVPSTPAAAAPAPVPTPAVSAIRDETVMEPDIDELDDRTVRRVAVDDDDLDATRARPSRPTAATLAFDTGDRFALTGAALIGRNPSPTTGEVVEHLLPFSDETRTVSKTHVLVTVAPLAVVDRASTNGSAVVRAGLEQQLEPGLPFALQPGDTVRFGDRTFTIEATA